MQKKYVLFLITCLLLPGWGCKSNAPVVEKKSATQSPPQAIAGKQPNEFIDGVPSLEGAKTVNEFKQRDAIRKYYNAMKLRHDGKLDAATDAFLETLKTDPLHLLARYQLAATLALNKRGSDSLAVLKQFQTAKGCSRCYVMLAKAKGDEAFKLVNHTLEFNDMVMAPASRLEKQLAEANWISYNADALKNRKIDLTFKGIPAISADGKYFLEALLGRDEKGRIQSATLQTLNADTGERASGKSLLLPQEGERLLSGTGYYREVMRALDDRIALIHNELVSKDWSPLTLAATASAEDLARCGAAQQFKIKKITVQLDAKMLKVTDSAGKTLTSRESKYLLPKSREVCATNVKIRRIYDATAKNALLMELAYCAPTCESRLMKWTSITW